MDSDSRNGELAKLAQALANMLKLAESFWESHYGSIRGFSELHGVPEAIELVDRWGTRGAIQSRLEEKK